jgi:hypothetical protein
MVLLWLFRDIVVQLACLLHCTHTQRLIAEAAAKKDNHSSERRIVPPKR